MKIDSIEIYGVSMPAVTPFTTSFGKSATFDGCIVKMTSGDLTGWGESLPLKFPAYSPECARTQFIMVRDLIAPLLCGKDIESGNQLQQMLSGIKGNYFAKAGFDLAWWELNAKMQKQPLWKLIGGVTGTIDVGADFGVQDSIDILLEKIQGAVGAGYKRIKLKACPGWDLNMVQAVRKKFPDAVIHIDCNNAYSLDDLDMFKEIDKYNLAMIEQPLAFDDLLDHAELQSHLKTPVCLDESITSPAKAAKAVKLKACRWVNIKLGRTGGLTNAVKIHNVCMEAGIPCWVGGMCESALGSALSLALSSLPNIKYPADVFPSSRFYERDLGNPPMIHSAPSQFKLSDKPGCGVEPVPELLDEYSFDYASFGK